MINKIKDFLKTKFSRRGKNQTEIDGSDQSDKTQVPSSTTVHIWDDEAPTRVKGLKGFLKKIKLPSLSKSSSSSSSGQSSLLSPSLSKSIEKILGRGFREPIHQFFLVSLICTVTYFLGKVTALGLKGSPTFGTPREGTVTISLENDFNPQTLNQVKSINPFKTSNGVAAKKKLADTKCEKPQQVSNLPIKLVNTIVLQDTVKSLASVQVRGDRLLQEVRVGEQISNLAKIFKISRLELLVKNLESGVCESISSDKLGSEKKAPISVLNPAQSAEFRKNLKMPGIENVGNKFNVSKKLMDEKLKDIGAILTQARALTIQNPDGTMSFKLTEMDPQGIFPYLGLQNDDIITSINGKPIYDKNEVMSLFGRIKNLENLSLGIKRDGSESVQEYSIKK